MKAQTYNSLPKVMGITIAFVLILGCGCTGKRVSAVEKCPHDNDIRTYEQWRHSVTFPYTAAENKLLRVKQNYERVAIGSTKDEVIQAFGSPDFEKEIHPKSSNRSCSYEFVYYFEKSDGNIDNEFNDKNVSVFFTPAGKAKWVVGNVGLAEKGSPAHDSGDPPGSPKR